MTVVAVRGGAGRNGGVNGGVGTMVLSELAHTSSNLPDDDVIFKKYLCSNLSTVLPKPAQGSPDLTPFLFLVVSLLISVLFLTSNGKPCFTRIHSNYP